nr:ribbon-helix-helix domain-containing protein [Microbacterium bovistercoris]
MGAKVSISLGEDDIAALDADVLAGRFASRSAAVQRALQLLRESELADAYAEAFGSWVDDGEAAAWDPATDDQVA